MITARLLNNSRFRVVVKKQKPQKRIQTAKRKIETLAERTKAKETKDIQYTKMDSKRTNAKITKNYRKKSKATITSRERPKSAPCSRFKKVVF